jgi:hypothetical protein
MMPAVMRRPPDRPTLGCGCSQQGKQKLTDSAGFKGFMREIPVIKGGNGKHSDQIRKQRHPYRHRAPADHKNQQANTMHQDKRYHPEPVNVFTGIIGFLYSVAIKPAQQLGKLCCQKHQSLQDFVCVEYLKSSRVTVA